MSHFGTARSALSQAPSWSDAAEVRLHVHEMDCADEAALVRRALAHNHGVCRRRVRSGARLRRHHVRSSARPAKRRCCRRCAAPACRCARRARRGRRSASWPPSTPALHDHDHHPHASTVATALSGVLFAAGWIIEGLAADHWLDVFVIANTARTIRARRSPTGCRRWPGLWPMWPRAVAAVRHLRLDMHALVCLTVIGAAAIGEWSEGAAVAFLFGARASHGGVEHRARARRDCRGAVAWWPQGRVAPAAVKTAWRIGRSAAGRAVDRAVRGDLHAGRHRRRRWSWRRSAAGRRRMGDWFYRALAVPGARLPVRAGDLDAGDDDGGAQRRGARAAILVKGGAVLERAATRRKRRRRPGCAGAGITVAGARDARRRAAGGRGRRAHRPIPTTRRSCCSSITRAARCGSCVRTSRSRCSRSSRF